MTFKWRDFAWWLVAGAALIIFLAIYVRCLSYPPVFDDFVHVIENRAIRYLFHPRIFFESEHTRSRPLPYFTFAISYYLAGMSLSALRVWSLAIHFANALLVGFLFRSWFTKVRGGMPWGSLAAALVFLFHPLAVDTVVYLSARGSLMVLFFILVALLIFGKIKHGFFSLFAFLLCVLAAFLSRESAAALALLLILVHLQNRRRWIELVPFLAPLLLGGVVVLALKSSYLDSAWRGFFGIQGDVDVHSPWEYFRLSLSLWPNILELFVNPWALSLDHQIFLPAGWASSSVLMGLGIWIGFIVALICFGLKRTKWLFPVCWLCLSLLPTNSIFPLLDPLSERHLYIALPALAWLLGLLVEQASLQLIAFPAVALVLVFLGFGSFQRIQQWQSPSELWLDAHKKAPGKYRVAYNATASLFLEKGDTPQAIRVFSETLRLSMPGSVRFEQEEQGLSLLVGALLSESRDSGQSVRDIWEKVHPEKDYWTELLLLKASVDSSSPAQWLSQWNASLARVEHEPLSPRARDPSWIKNTFLLLKAGQLKRQEKYREALQIYESVILPFGPSHFPYWNAREALGDLYMRFGRPAEAVEQYELAAFQYKVFKRFPYELQKKLFDEFQKKGDLRRASDAIGELVRIQSDNPELRRLYANLLSQRKDRHAVRQSKEASYYELHAVLPTDDREAIRP